MQVDLFAGINVADFASARSWYERFLGTGPDMEPHATEAVWQLAEHRFVYILESPERAGNGLVTLFLDDLDTFVEGITERGIEPTKRETYSNGVRKVTYLDPDGNELGLGGGPRAGRDAEN